MRLSLNWLRKHIDYGLSFEELAYRLTMAGLEVESVEKLGSDVVFEIEITPNRPDCLNILGLAREVSAALDKDLSVPIVTEYEDVASLDIGIEDTSGCSRYIGTAIDGVKVQACTDEYARFLQAVGVKPISNIVDITNFVMFEVGQPLHAFDLDKLEGGKIIVRRARKGEKLVTLDDVDRALDESILVIADEKKPVAIAGIMGGRDTGVTPATKRILLEAASFDLGVIRRGSRKLGLTSDSCYRFERGVAWRTVETGANRATALILEMAGGRLIARKDMIAKTPEQRRTEIVVSLADIQSLLGTALELSRCEKILKRLGCIVVGGAQELTVIPPHFRNDLRIKEDVIEELARVVGYDNLSMSLPHVKAENIVVNEDGVGFNRRVRDLMIAQGFHEVVTYALMSKLAMEKINYKGPVIALQNPMSAEQEILRPTALANLLLIGQANINRGRRDLKLFEVGKRYLPDGERWILSVLATGRKEADWRRSKKDLIDCYDIKGVVEEIFIKLRVSGVTFSAGESSALASGQTVEIRVQGKEIGVAGKVRSDVLAHFDIKKTSVFFAEIELDSASAAVLPREKFAELNEFPSTVRDISLAVKEVQFEELRSLCRELGGDILQKVDFVELYVGDKLEAGHKGYVLSLTYQASDRTLTDDEVNRLHEKIVDKLITKFGVKRR